MTSGLLNSVTNTIGMAPPLTELGDTAMNSTTPNEIAKSIDYEVTMQTSTTVDDDSNGPPSSPFVANVASESLDNRENMSPSPRLSLLTKSPIIDRDKDSPLKMLKRRPSSTTSRSQSPRKDIDLSTTRSPRKISAPEKRFPVKVSSPNPSLSSDKRPIIHERTVSIEDVLRDNEGLTKAIEIMEDGDSENSDFNEEHISHVSDETLGSTAVGTGYNDDTIMDDTMVSTFSAFSTVPDMTSFAKLGRTPAKLADLGATPRRTQSNTPAALRRPPMNDLSPEQTPRAHRYGTSRDDINTTNLIVDFTEQFNGFSGRASPRKGSPLKSATMPDMTWASTPSANRTNVSNLLDFDIPPAPTPRSMPSITPRELESLKSGFLSEISSLKASLSGKEAELSFYKTAVGDAEKRVGETMEKVREESDLRAQLASEKEEWEKRSREMEAVLRNVKEEIVHGERERDELEGRLEESEMRREAAEVMAQETERKIARMKAGKTPPDAPASPSGTRSSECICNGKAVEQAVDKVSRELHTLYKEKHETKVSALKKSYENRWGKKVKELESQVDGLRTQNEEMKLGRDTTTTKVNPKDPAEVAADLDREAAREAKSRELEAELEGMSKVVESVKQDNAELRHMLEEERVEKGKLVQAVDEMIPLVAAFDDMLANQMAEPPPQKPITTPLKRGPSAPGNFRNSMSKAPSGLKLPGKPAGESRIGRGGFGAPAGMTHERNGSRSGSASGTRPGSGLGYRSGGLMSSIDKMGAYKGRGE